MSIIRAAAPPASCFDEKSRRDHLAGFLQQYLGLLAARWMPDGDKDAGDLDDALGAGAHIPTRTLVSLSSPSVFAAWFRLQTPSSYRALHMARVKALAWIAASCEWLAGAGSITGWYRLADARVGGTGRRYGDGVLCRVPVSVWPYPSAVARSRPGRGRRCSAG